MKTMKLKISLLQIAPTDTVQGNLEKDISSCREARRHGADIALFPEMCSIGYDIHDRRWKMLTARLFFWTMKLMSRSSEKAFPD